METSFKRAASHDLETLLVFMREFYEFEHLSFDERVARTALAKLLADESCGRVWMIYVGDEAVGYVVLTLGYSLEFRGRDAFIDELYMREGYRGQGAGKSALKFVEEACRALGIQALHLEVGRDNPNAQALYRKVGFQDHDRYLMTKWISPLAGDNS
jgi:GNAT superfamily N-acetyltransferase